MAISDRRFHLRTETAAAHAALDRAVGPLDGLQAYRRYLLGLYAGRAPIERAFAAAEPSPSLLADDMARDIADLGLAAPDLRLFPLQDELSARLGVCYVLEGSALGARLLLPQAAGLGLGAEYGARHLDRQVRSTGWQDFLRRLDAAEPYDARRAANAAAAAFRFIHRAMTDLPA